MAAKKSKKVTVQLDAATIKALLDAAAALSELAAAVITGSDDPKVRALGKKKSRR